MNSLTQSIILLLITIGILIWLVGDRLPVIGFTKTLEIFGLGGLGAFLLSLPFWFKPLIKWMDSDRPFRHGVEQ